MSLSSQSGLGMLRRDGEFGSRRGYPRGDAAIRVASRASLVSARGFRNSLVGIGHQQAFRVLFGKGATVEDVVVLLAPFLLVVDFEQLFAEPWPVFEASSSATSRDAARSGEPV